MNILENRGLARKCKIVWNVFVLFETHAAMHNLSACQPKVKHNSTDSHGGKLIKVQVLP